MLANGFNAVFEEKAEFNQYWYSTFSIQKIADEVCSVGGTVGLLSTPSIYFSLPEDVRAKCYLFDFDDCWKNDRGFVFYDFNTPSKLPADFLGRFDLLVIDPPFITEEVWRKYAESAHLLLKKGVDAAGVPNGKVILTTVIENAHFLHELFEAKPTPFMPSIPNLVYQYNLFTNFPPTVLSSKNPEIPE